MTAISTLISAGGGSASQINEVVTLNNSANTVTLADGRVYLRGGVVETTLSTYPLANAGFKNLGAGFSTSSQENNPSGLAWDGTHFWVCGFQNSTVYKYNTSGVYQNVNFSVAGQATNPIGIVWDGSFFWVLFNSNKTIYKYNSAGVYQNINISVASQVAGETRGFGWDGTYFYVSDWSQNIVYKYNSAGVYQNVSFSTLSGAKTPAGIGSDGTHLYIVSNSNPSYGTVVVHKYTTAGVYTGDNFSVSNTLAYGITFDGTSFSVVDNTVEQLIKFSPAVGVTAVANIGGQNYVRVA